VKLFDTKLYIVQQNPQTKKKKKNKKKKEKKKNPEQARKVLISFAPVLSDRRKT